MRCATSGYAAVLVWAISCTTYLAITWNMGHTTRERFMVMSSWAVGCFIGYLAVTL